MNKILVKVDVQFLIILFLSMFLFGSLIEGFTKIKYIGLYGAILFYLIDIVKSRTFLYKQYFLENRTLFVSLFLFIFSIILSIIFAFSDISPSIKEFRVEFLNSFIFLLIALNIRNRELLIKTVFIAIIFAFLFDVIKYGYYYIKSNPHLNLSKRLDRNFANYFEVLYAFVFISFFIFKNRIIKFVLFLMLLVGLFELLLTGVRGAWISVMTETILLVLFLGIYYKNFKNILFYLIGIILILGIGGFFIYKKSSLLQEKIHQGLTPGGRDVIVKTRLPIFLKHSNLIIGIGGPANYQYNQFLNYYKAPQVYGTREKNRFHYWGDEPFLLQIFYKEGILGLFTFLLLVFILLYQGYKNVNLYVLGILTSFIGYYLVRGLVEGRELKLLLIYITLFLVAKEKNENSISLS